QALDHYARALALQPSHAAPHSHLGVALKDLGRLAQSMASHDRAVALAPNSAQAHANRGVTLSQLEQLPEALACFDRAIAIQPAYVEALTNRGVVLQKLGQLEQALASHEQALAIDPSYAVAHCNLGTTLKALGRLDEALASFERALSIAPNHADALANRGTVLKELGRLDEAVACHDRAIALKPNNSHIHANRGNALKLMGKIEQALHSYDRAIALQPDNQSANWNKSHALLLQGNLAQGWALFESRWKINARGMQPRPFVQPLWLGEQNIAGKTILLHAEQGMGDTIQFCRFARLVKALGARVLLEVPKALASLLCGLEGVDELLVSGAGLPPFDYHCPLMSLPLALGTDLSNIPSAQQYIHADTQKVAYWQQRLGPASGKRVGLVWNGGFRANQPELWAVNERRNISLEQLSRALNTLNVSFYSLQKGDPAESELRGQEQKYWPRGNLTNLADELADFSDTAALIENLDLVISVDTSTAHLAAALRKPTWILNRFDTCWRWMLNRTDSPWYESVRLYRQGTMNCWEPVLERVANDLAVMAAEQPTQADTLQADGHTAVNLEHQLFQLGLAQLEQNEPLKAVPYFEQVVRANPMHFDALHLLGLIALHLGDAQLALDFISQAIAINPQSQTFHDHRSLAMQQLNTQRQA
ncbi:MAG: tetratricopeptide repeat protein, partial [Hylemonella sp.]